MRTLALIILVPFLLRPVGAHQEEEPTAATEPVEVEEEFQLPPLMTALTEHLHNKMVHFPIALGGGALVLQLAGLRWPAFLIPGGVVATMGALGASGSYLTGLRAEEEYEEGPKEWVVERHQQLGLFVLITYWIWVLLSFWPRSRRWAWIWGLAVNLLIGWTGFYGGLLSHG